MSDKPRIRSRFLILMNGKTVTLFIGIGAGGEMKTEVFRVVEKNRNTGVKSLFSL